MYISSDIKSLFHILRKHKLLARIFSGNRLSTKLVVLNCVSLFLLTGSRNCRVDITNNRNLAP